MELITILAAFGTALAVRLTRGRQWIAWVIWLGLSLIFFLILMAGKLSAEGALAIVAVGSVVGFIGQEIWQIIRGLGQHLRQSMIRFLSRPRNVGIILFLLFFFYALRYQSELLKGLIAIVIMLGALWLIVRPLWRSLFGGSRRR